MEIDPTQMRAMELQVMESKENNDDRDMARLGKSPVLKVKRPLSPQAILFVLLLMIGQRNFGFMSILGFSCTVVITWEGFLMYDTILELPPRQ